MTACEITTRARFDRIRYAQVWEDADVLVAALRPKAGDVVLSIGSAGDNCLALLAEGVEKVIAVDLSSAQLACIRIRKAALSMLSHREYLELMGSRTSDRRGEIFSRVASVLSERDQSFWTSQRRAVEMHGLGGIGKFETYLRHFRRMILPIAHSPSRVCALLSSKPSSARAKFYDTRWNSWRWRALVGLFFSRPVMGRLGRDPSFFDYVEGGAAAHVAQKVRQAAVEQDPSDNPYAHWILKGRHGETLPRPLTQECFESARIRLDRLEIRRGSIEALADKGVRADAFNLSDIFEYMSPSGHENAYRQILNMARPGARLAYWNMLAPRRAPVSLASRIRRQPELEKSLRAQDKAFFYSDFVVEEVLQ